MVHTHVHSHEDEHHHHHVQQLDHVGRAFIAGISLNFLFVIIEVIAGLYIHSLSLLSDAGHNLADVAALALSLLAFRLVKVKPNDQYTYGYSKTTILVALFNGMVLLVSVGIIAFEAMHRFMHPEPLPGKTIALIAAIGIVINASTALLFFRDRKNDLNIRSAYLHLLSDAIVSAGIVIGGLLIFYTGYSWIDPLLSMVIVLVILFSTWNLLKHSLRLSLDAVPANLNVEKIRQAAEKIPGVKNMHHIHVWAISTTRNAMTAHIMVENSSTLTDIENIKRKVKHSLAHFDIHHITLEVEPDRENCEEC